MPPRAKRLDQAKEAKLRRNLLVKTANKATKLQIQAVVPKVFDFKNVTYDTKVLMSSKLSVRDKAVIWEMLDNSMRQLYVDSTMGWDPPSKKKELFGLGSRFIVLRRSQAQDGVDHLQEDLPIMAYTMFRFEVENEECVLYCYELQVSPSVQGGGIGTALMGCLYDIAHKWNMCKIVLTVLHENKIAFSLYEKMGYKIEEKGDDYAIVSKLVEP